MSVCGLLDFDNPSGLKFWAMGFRLQEAMIRTSMVSVDDDFIGKFICVCGRMEQLYLVIPAHATVAAYARHFNFYHQLDHAGSMDREHLIADGYPVETVEEMIERGRDLEFGRSIAEEAYSMMEPMQGWQSGRSLRLACYDYASFYARLLETRNRWRSPTTCWMSSAGMVAK